MHATSQEFTAIHWPPMHSCDRIRCDAEYFGKQSHKGCPDHDRRIFDGCARPSRHQRTLRPYDGHSTHARTRTGT